MKSQDKYRSYAELRESECEGIDFRICITDRAEPVAIIAPHGGKIEPGTSEIATAIAGDCYRKQAAARRKLDYFVKHKFSQESVDALAQVTDIGRILSP